MAPSTVHLPNGQTLTVSPSFGGLFFKSNDLSTHQNVFPPGWTIILHSEDDEEAPIPPSVAAHTHAKAAFELDDEPRPRRHHIHRFKKPTLRSDHLFISSISNPSSSDFKPPSSPTRQIAMMLWATLWWYFHQPPPDQQLNTEASAGTAEGGKPKGEWRININREGIFMGKHLLPKLERMGLIASEDSAVGVDPDDGVSARGANEGWQHCFVSRRSFWQLDARIYLFTMAPATGTSSPYPALSPANSRPASPNRGGGLNLTSRAGDNEMSNTSSLSATGNAAPSGLWRNTQSPGPFSSGSHLPTFYPPPPLQYTLTNGMRHPIRPKPPRQGEIFYTRYIPSLDQYLSFRVASMSPRACAHRGPVTSPRSSDPLIPTINSLRIERDTTTMSDLDLMHKWMNDPRVSFSWGEQGPKDHQAKFLATSLSSKNSFPAIGCFDGRPFGYFEIYWVKEDRLSGHLGGLCGDWDRGIHCLVGENEFRGQHRVKVWLSALVHYCWLADMRTQAVYMEPRVDNDKLKQYCEEAGFWKEREISFPHKQSNLMKIKRESWDCPAL